MIRHSALDELQDAGVEAWCLVGMTNRADPDPSPPVWVGTGTPEAAMPVSKPPAPGPPCGEDQNRSQLPLRPLPPREPPTTCPAPRSRSDSVGSTRGRKNQPAAARASSEGPRTPSPPSSRLYRLGRLGLALTRKVHTAQCTPTLLLSDKSHYPLSKITFFWIFSPFPFIFQAI